MDAIERPSPPGRPPLDTPPGHQPGGAPSRVPGRPAGRPAASLKRLAALLKSCHPGPTVVVTLLVAGLAVAAGQDTPGCVLATAAVLAGQLSVGWSNDAVDAVRDTAVGRGDKPVAGGAVGARTVRNAALVALVLCVPLSLLYGLLAGAVHLAGVLAAWAYNFGLKSTPLSWLPYAIGFASLPAFVTLGLPGAATPAWWIVTAAALVGVGAHLGNVLPDIEADLATGVRGWPQRLGPTAVRLLLPLPLVAATILLALGRPGALGAVAVGVALVAAVGGAVLGSRRPKLPFLAAIVVAAADVTLLLTQGAALS
ncbi:UbiA family prenyltransferase [Streptomyces sp. 150FB]|uniref:UbiA family prenyltransferase n=1 Tax=Streptomyces sp. 150FB TaxID=1576605 RepID=UPI00099B9350|nr:UbiA family prenyltransferase [Streptomyces sp. 150FB]